MLCLNSALMVSSDCCAMTICAELQVRKATQAYQETVVFLDCPDRLARLDVGVQMEFLDWMEDQVFA